ncbi:MAG TPA: putative LPS assembly protein LptD [Bacteroidales bacterium]|nr:putative LPS assembly protein LptD [Bacteroidales bacterium]
MLLALVLRPAVVRSQDTVPAKIPDTLQVRKDTLHPADSLAKPVKKEKLKAKVDYQSTDSLRFDIKNQKVYLFKDAEIKYQDIDMKAAYVEIDFPKTQVYATFMPDSAGKMQGRPDFTQGSQEFKSKVMRYNYDTKEGYIQTVITKQDEGYLHGEVVKKMENDVTYLKNGSYTTCDKEDYPDYQFKFGRGKVIPGKKVITGPAYMEIGGSPTPLIIPFGYFPNKSGHRSGIVLPTYGESPNRGFYLQQGGYYWWINDYMDLKLVGDIYSHGSWAVTPTFRYAYRYHFSGYLSLGYSLNRIGYADAPGFSKKKDFQIRWVHTQDSKARPHSTFSANVNILSSTYNQNNLSTSAEAYLSNTYQSSVNYSTNWNDLLFFTLNLNHSQNTLNKTVSLTLPEITFYINQVYPFRKKVHTGKMHWWENISTKYTLEAKNTYNTIDSLLFKPGWQNQMSNGIRHTVPISGTFRILKYFNWTNAINMTDRMYIQTIRKEYIPGSVAGKDTLVTDTVYGFRNAFDANFATSINTRIYGMFQFKKGPVLAIRHMMVPSVAFSYTPNWGSPSLGYWKYIDNDTNKVNPQKYTIFQNGIYGAPPPQKAGLISFALSNNLEMKVRDRKDTVTGTRKIKLIEDFTIRASYDMARDSLRWSPVTLSGYTTLFKYLRITYGSTWDPYARDSSGNRINQSELSVNHRLFRLDNTTWTVGLNYSLSSEKVKKTKPTEKGTAAERSDIEEFYDYYIDFDIPWSFSIGYNFTYTKDWNAEFTKRVPTIVQTLNLSGQLNITPKWKISLTTGWDFRASQLAYTRVDVYRDLHCWEMRFGWVPKGGQQQWDFSINVKASILQDMKLNKKKDFRDYSQ